MHKLTYLFAALGIFAMLSISCSDTESAKPTEISLEQNDTSTTSLKTDTLFDPNHLRDSILARFDMATAGYAQEPGTAQPTTSSSHTSYNFKTEKEAFYEENGCYVNIYEKESGVRYLPSRKGGYFEMTSLVYPEEGVVLRLLNNSYWGGSCETDSKTFLEECENDGGILKDYKDGKGCSQNQKLELACAFLVDFGSTRAMLQREANLYKRDCDGAPQTQAQECSVSCSMVDEVHCDTVCKNLE